MAKRVVLIDDLDESITDDVETITFSVGKHNYSVDLGADNREKFYNALDPFIKVAVSGNNPTSTVKREAVPAKQIREWAKTQPSKISSLVKSERGAVPKAIIAAYNEVHGTKY